MIAAFIFNVKLKLSFQRKLESSVFRKIRGNVNGTNGVRVNFAARNKTADPLYSY